MVVRLNRTLLMLTALTMLVPLGAADLDMPDPQRIRYDATPDMDGPGEAPSPGSALQLLARQVVPDGDAGTGHDIDIHAISTGKTYEGYLHFVGTEWEYDTYTFQVGAGEVVRSVVYGLSACQYLKVGDVSRLACPLQSDSTTLEVVAAEAGQASLRISSMVRLTDAYRAYHFIVETDPEPQTGPGPLPLGLPLGNGDADTGGDIYTHPIRSGEVLYGYLDPAGMITDTDRYEFDAQAGDVVQVSVRSPMACYSLYSESSGGRANACAMAATGGFLEYEVQETGRYGIMINSGMFGPSPKIPYRISVAVNEPVDPYYNDEERRIWETLS